MVRAMAVIALALLAGCAPVQRKCAPWDGGTPFGRELYYATLERGASVPVETLAMAGLRGMTEIDPALGIRREGNAIVVERAGAPPDRTTVSPWASVQQWREKSVDILSAARRLSPAVAAEPADMVQDRLVAALHAAYPPQPDCAAKPAPAAPPVNTTLSPIRPTLPPAPVAASAPGEVAAAVLDLAHKVASQHVEPVPAARVVFDSLSGLTALDPQIAVARTADAITVSRAGTILARTVPPRDDDDDAALKARWTILYEAARRASPAVERADRDDVIRHLADAALQPLGTNSRWAVAASRPHVAGIGVTIRPGGAPDIGRVLPSSPAERGGLRAGNRLESIDGQKVAGKPPEAITTLLNGPAGSSVTVSYRRDGRSVSRTIERQILAPVFTDFRDGVLVLNPHELTQPATVDAKAAIARAKGMGLRGVVVDLRGNSGGVLDQVVAWAEMFVAEGKLLTARDRRPAATRHYEAGHGSPGEGVPTIVLVDGETASGAELLASVLQLRDAAIVVGSSTQGNGGIRTAIPMQGFGTMILATGWLEGPAGWSIHGIGMSPTLCTTPAKGGLAKVLGQIRNGVAASARAAAGGVDADRQAARHACPPMSRAGESLDMAVAEALLADPALYARALAPPRP